MRSNDELELPKRQRKITAGERGTISKKPVVLVPERKQARHNHKPDVRQRQVFSFLQ
jgi:hypothetical protein